MEMTIIAIVSRFTYQPTIIMVIVCFSYLYKIIILLIEDLLIILFMLLIIALLKYWNSNFFLLVLGFVLLMHEQILKSVSRNFMKLTAKAFLEIMPYQWALTFFFQECQTILLDQVAI